ncbi:MAG: geranyl-CoA carboxylase alpha subunit [Myxococcota bacterium]|jgi:geranyl-CoA carboxylase alpha subunit
MSSFTTLLIANRGEIAVRVITTAHALGYRTVAVFSDADADAPHVALADMAVHIGPAPASQSYLSIETILDAAARSGADAIHPGYGFLSERADFARACAEAGIVFVGPPPSAVAAMGDKAAARKRMTAAGVAVVPGYDGDDQADAAFLTAADAIGYPLLVKASAGGGGRGMRRVDGPDGLLAALASARSEATSAFGSDRMLLERLITAGRHVEIQVFADTHGTTIHLGERDCSAQRRHQKVIEEAPSPAVSPALRAKMGAAAVAAAEAVGYVGAGTVEFLLTDDGDFYFLEMNTRLQVEHPVTEAVTGLDLVALQLQVAAGAPLGLTQADVTLTGHAIEVRLYAEDPARDYAPQTGTVAAFRPPEGIRCDHGLVDGLVISPHYDPMLAKLIVHGRDRQTALRKLTRGLEQTALLGLTTNRRFLLDLLAHPTMIAGEVRTDFLASPQAAELLRPASPTSQTLAAAALCFVPTGAGFRSVHAVPQPVLIDVDGVTLRVTIDQTGTVTLPDSTTHTGRLLPGEGVRRRLLLDGILRDVFLARCGETLHLTHGRDTIAVCAFTPKGAGEVAGSGTVTAPGAGSVIAVLVAAGDTVAVGDALVVLEAMKLETTLRATVAGAVSVVRVAVGQQVKTRQVLMIIEEIET